jgi:hypothetical protein
MKWTTISMAIVFLFALGFHQCEAQGRTLAEEPVAWCSLVVEPTCKPVPFLGSDGRTNLAYELTLTNFKSKPASIEKIDIVDAASPEKMLLTLSGEKLKGVVSCVNVPHERLTLQPGETGVAWINIVLATPADVPDTLLHRIWLGLDADADSQANDEGMDQVIVAVDKKPALVIGSPVKGTRWFAMGGYCGKLGHRRALMPVGNKLRLSQRYAIDWIKFDESYNSWKGPQDLVTNSYCYGEPVLACADATVAGVVEGFPDQPPYKTSTNMKFPAGNSITLDLGNGLYALYAHIRPGGARVKTGDKVKRGQEIGLIGSSGHSTEPHLHFHISDSAAALGGNGVPYVIDEFKMDAEVKDLDMFGTDAVRKEPAVVAVDHRRTIHKNELPKEGAVVSFD